MLVHLPNWGDPKDGQRLKYQPFIDVGSKIPEALKDRAMALYKIAGSELAKYPSQVLCFAIEEFLSTTMTSPELAAFKASAPMKFPIIPYKNILEEMAAEDPSVAEWLAQQTFFKEKS